MALTEGKTSSVVNFSAKILYHACSETAKNL